MTLPRDHVSAILSDCATPGGSIFGALRGLGYSAKARGRVTLDALHVAAACDPSLRGPMPRAVRVARALDLAGYVA